MQTKYLVPTLIALCLVGGCTYQTNAAFPVVPPAPAAHAGAQQVGLARVVDRRGDRVSGNLNEQLEVLVGPELDDYLERRLRTELVLRDFAPVEALNPGNNPASSKDRTVVVVVQSVSIGVVGSFSRSCDAVVDVAVQIYAPSSRSPIFSHDYEGQGSAKLSFSGSASVISGGVVSMAADNAIAKVLDDAEFDKALK